MAFQRANGYNNLPNGAFSPTIYSKKVQKAFRKSSVIQDITNTDYTGEISDYGDSVKIIKEPEIAVNDYARGTTVVPQDLEDSDFTMMVDRADYYAFKVDDIERAHSHVNWQDMASDRAAYRLKDKYDADILAYMTGFDYDKSNNSWTPRTSPVGTKAQESAGPDELLSQNKLDRSNFGYSNSNAITLGLPSQNSVKGTDFDASPLAVMNRMSRLLDQNNVDTEDRYFVADPVFYELLQDEESKLLDSDFSDTTNIIRNGRISNGMVRGFKLYKSNNLPRIGNGPGVNSGGTDGSNTDYGIIMAGHMSAVATAQQLSKNETHRDHQSFADVVRGMHLYCRKILRPESLIVANYSVQ